VEVCVAVGPGLREVEAVVELDTVSERVALLQPVELSVEERVGDVVVEAHCEASPETLALGVLVLQAEPDGE